MNWAWGTSLDEIWRSPAFPMWLTLAAAGFFGIIVLITLLRAEKSVANGALTVITLLAVGIAVAATIRSYGPTGRGVSNENRSSPTAMVALPALACIDDLAGDTVLSACEKSLFGSAESVAAAVTYTASQISRLTALGDAAVADGTMPPELRALRRALERDRYGLVAQVLVSRDRCTPTACPAFLALPDRRQIVANMDEHVYDNLLSRYAPSWNVPATSPIAALPTSVPTGRPTTAEFPSAASTPPVNIMAPEPSAAPPQRPNQPAANTAASAPKPPTATGSTLAAAKKPPPKPPARPATTSAPVQIAPTSPAPASAPAAPAASND